MRQGEIYLILDRHSGKRPVIVISRDNLNRGHYFLAVPLTSQRLETRRNLANCVLFPKGAFGLSKECVAQAEAATQLRKDKLAHPAQSIGKLSDSAVSRLIAAMGNVMAADCMPAREAESAAPGGGDTPTTR